MSDQNWRVNARCAQDDIDPETFYPGPGSNGHKALRLCKVCPVAVDCLIEALSEERSNDHGVWGGTTHEQRVLLRNSGRVLSRG